METPVMIFRQKKFWWRFLAGATLATLLFCLYSVLPLTAPNLHDSPDETANAFFTTRFAEDSVLYYLQKWNFYAPQAVHPRSVAVVGDFLVPVGFLGLPVIFGSLAKLLGTAVVPFLTPVFALFGVIGWGLLVAHFFGRRAGRAAALLLAVNPVWWYETARTLQPNVLFLTLVIWAVYLLVAAPLARVAEGRGRLLPWTDGPLAGLLLALALAVRTSEAYWLLAAALAVVAFQPRLPWRRVLLAFLFAVLGFAPFLLINTTLYGHLLATGYGALGAAVTGEQLGGWGMRLLGPLQPYLFPLGFAPRTALQNFWTYGVAFFPWWSLLVTAAVLDLLRRRPKFTPSRRALVAAGATATAWLILFYGSWTVHDNPDTSAVTIGSSYLRYWLPIFALSTVPVAVAAAHRWEQRRERVILAAGAVFVAAVGAATVFLSPAEGLAAVRSEIIRYDRVTRTIMDLTPPKAIIVTDRADKFIFPRRDVIQPLRSDATYAAMGALAKKADLYYFGITLPEGDVAWLNSHRLPPPV